MDQFYKSLKSSPLAQDRETGSLEEAAIWLDMNANSLNNIIKIFKTVEKNYHIREDDLMESYYMHCLTAKSTQQSKLRPIFKVSNEYFSDRLLFWLLKTIKKTNALDKAVLCKKFMSYAVKARDKHRENIKRSFSIGTYKKFYISHEDEALYEVFAELVDILNEKLAVQYEVK